MPKGNLAGLIINALRVGMPIVLYRMSTAIEQQTVVDKQQLIFTQILRTMTPSTTEQKLEQGILKSKIMDLQSALFFTESVSIVKLPTHVISDVEVDEEGNIWFVIPKPTMHIEAFEKEIPAKLDFFKKGMDFFVKVRGVATLLTETDEIMSDPALSAEMRERMKDTNVIGVKVKVVDSDLVDNTPKPSQSWLQSSRSQLSSWFF
jgi:hypothetical protein